MMTGYLVPDGQITSDFPKSCQAQESKIFLFAFHPNHFTSLAIRFRRGALAIVTNVGTGCGGRGSVGAQS
jgi:hypothetical protein